MNLNDNDLITTDGEYTLDRLQPGREYLLTMKGVWGGGTLELFFYNGASTSPEAVDDGSWDGSGATEARFIAPSTSLLLYMSGSSGAELKITIKPIVH